MSTVRYRDDDDGSYRRGSRAYVMDDGPSTAQILIDAVDELLGLPGFKPDIPGWFVTNPQRDDQPHFYAQILGPENHNTTRVLSEVAELAASKRCVVVQHTDALMILTRMPS